MKQPSGTSAAVDGGAVFAIEAGVEAWDTASEREALIYAG